MTTMTDAQVELMESSSSREEWGANIDKVKAEHDGQYPEDWYPKIISSGLCDRVAATFGESGKITVTALTFALDVEKVKQHGRCLSYTPAERPLVPHDHILVMALNNGIRWTAFNVTEKNDYAAYYKKYAEGWFLNADLYLVPKQLAEECVAS